MKYKDKWISNASDEELSLEREKVRQDFCNSDFDDNYREECYTTLGRFDREMSKRAWGDDEPKSSSIHREHGWYLPNDDDWIFIKQPFLTEPDKSNVQNGAVGNFNVDFFL